MLVTTRRIWLGGLGGVALTHVVGCASQSTAAVGLSSPARDAGQNADVDARAPRGELGAGSDPPAADRALVGAGEHAKPASRAVEALAPPPELRLPPRPPGAETGSRFIERIEGLGRAAIDEQVVAAVVSGNVPPFERRLAPIDVVGPGGERARLFVTCDYLAIGSDEDFIRMPMTSAAAQRIANLVDASLPTKKLVDVIYEQAPAKLPPSWIDGGPTEGTLADFTHHQETLEERRKARGLELGVLTAGDKKDIVLSRKMVERPDHVAIYGWHRSLGDPVQPLSCAHSCRYADYSHGVRLVAEDMTIDGAKYRFSEVLVDPDLADLLSDEGPLPVVEYSTVLPEYTGRTASKKRR
jgi:hypothetical protein